MKELTQVRSLLFVKCDKTFRTSQVIKKHERTHTGEKLFSCKLCDKKFTERRHLQSHERTHTGNLFSCKLCDKKFTEERSVQRHRKTCTGKKTFNDSIAAENTSKALVVEDNVTLNEEDFSGFFCLSYSFFECEFCEEKFENDECYRKHLKIHVRPWKKSKKKYSKNLQTCELCEFRDLDIMEHMKTFHKVTKTLKKEHECLICFLEHEPLALFCTYEGIRIHIKRKHETEQWKFCCNKCDSRFINAVGLESHVKSLHKVPNPSHLYKLRKLKSGNYVLKEK